MAKEVGVKIKISSEGGEKVISNLNELETELQALQTQLKSADFGSEKFKAIAQDIQTLKSRIEDVDKSTEGLGVEKRLAAINATTGLLTGSFQALAGILGTITDDEETLAKVQQAEANALNALNIALGIRAVSEGILESRLFRRIAAEKIANASTKAFIATAKGVSATLKAIGINAGVASTGVRILTASLYALGIPALIAGFAALVDVLTETNDELENKAPKTAAGYYDELNQAIKDLEETQQIRLDNAKSLGDSELEIAQQELQNKKDIYEQLKTEYDDLWSTYSFLLGEVNRNEDTWYSKSKTNFQKQADEVKKNIDKVVKDLSRYGIAIRNSEKNITDIQKRAEEKRAADAKAAYDKAIALQVKNIQERLKLQQDFLNDIKDIAQQEYEVSADVIDKINNLIGRQEELLTQRQDFFKSDATLLSEQVRDLLYAFIPTDEEKQLLEDAYYNIFTSLTNDLSNNYSALGKELVEGGRKSYEELKKLANDVIGSEFIKDGATITDEARNSLVQYFATINKVVKDLRSEDFTKIFGEVFGTPEDAFVFIDGVRKYAAELGRDTTLVYGELEEKLTKYVELQLKGLNLVEKSTKTNSQTTNAANEAYNTNLQTLIETLTGYGKAQGKVVNESDKVNTKIEELTKKLNLNIFI